MPYKNGRFIRGGKISAAIPISKTEEIQNPEEVTEKKIIEKIKNIKIEEEKQEDSKGMKERLKKFVNLKI